MKNSIIQPVYAITGRARRACAVSVLIAALLALGLTVAPAAFGDPPTTAASAQDDIDSLPVKAPDVGTITQRTTTGARSGPKFGLYLFAPGTVGATVKEHPTFYWYLGQQSEDDTEVVVTEVAPQKTGVKPSQLPILMRKKYAGTQPPGIYAATLDEAALQPRTVYQVSVVVHLSSGASTGEVVNSIGYLARLPDSGADADDPAACAKAGLWYDAIDAAMRRIAKDSTGLAPRHQLHAMLRGEHVFSSSGPAELAGNQAAKQEEKALFDRLDDLHDALIMTRPPAKTKHGR